MRDTIFISHATPDDNEFVRWLGARLTGHGYKVWADLFELKGGTPFWTTIEEALRHHALKVIFVVSRTSVDPSRSGVRNELSVADAIKKQLSDPSFIVPVRIDDTPFGEFPIQIHQLNAIDFSRGWGGKLVELLDTLEHAKVPRLETDQGAAFSAWRSTIATSAALVENSPEPVVTNLLTIKRLPEQIFFYQAAGNQEFTSAAVAASQILAVPFYRLLISFDDLETLRKTTQDIAGLTLRAAVATADFLDGKATEVTSPRKDEARRMVVGLLKKHVERHLILQGLKPYDTSSGTAFFFPDKLIEQNKVTYVAANGKKTWKNVVGKSERYKVFWHLAMKVTINLGEFPIVRFKPYVCFSEDGQSPITDPKRTSALRKRFCKNWWNAHWRQLQQAFTAFLSNDGADIEVAAGSPLIIAGQLMELTGARRLPDDLLIAEEPETPAEPDAFEDDELLPRNDEEEEAA